MHLVFMRVFTVVTHLNNLTFMFISPNKPKILHGIESRIWLAQQVCRLLVSSYPTHLMSSQNEEDILSSIDRLKKTKSVKLLLCCTVYEKKPMTFYLPQAFHQTAKKCLLLL